MSLKINIILKYLPMTTNTIDKQKSFTE